MAAARSSLVGTSGNNHPELVCPIPLLEDYFFPLGGGGDNDSGDATGLMEFSDDTEDPRVPKKPDRVPRRQWRGAKNLHSSNVVPTAAQSSTNLIVRRFSRVVDEHELRRVFSPFGEILSAAVMRNIYTGENLGTAFVRFATHDEARAALVNCHGLHLHGCTISVHWARRQHDDTPVGEARRRIFKLFVRNIPLDVTPDDMARVFGCFGPVGGVTLHKDTAGCSCGCEVRRIGFVAFLAEGAAERAASGIHNTRPFPSCQQIPLMVKLAEDAPTHKRRQATAPMNSAWTGAPQPPLPNQLQRPRPPSGGGVMHHPVPQEGCRNCPSAYSPVWKSRREVAAGSPASATAAQYFPQSAPHGTNVSSGNYCGCLMPQMLYGTPEMSAPCCMRGGYAPYRLANQQRMLSSGMMMGNGTNPYNKNVSYMHSSEHLSHMDRGGISYSSQGLNFPQTTLGSNCSSLRRSPDIEEPSTATPKQYIPSMMSQCGPHMDVPASPQGKLFSTVDSFYSTHGTNTTEESFLEESLPGSGSSTRVTRYTHNPYQSNHASGEFADIYAPVSVV